MHIPGFGAPGTFRKGNIHLHSTNSDGSLPPDQVVEAYKSRGYDFVAITDHFLPRAYLDGLLGREASGDQFITVTDTTSLRTPDFTTILGAEIHGPGMSNGTNWHMVALGLPADFAPWDGQESGAAITERAAKTGAFIGIAHPAASTLTMEDVKQVLPFSHSIEIYNHGANIFGMGESWHFADLVYAEGHRLSAYAADDSHATGAATSVIFRDHPAYGENATEEERARFSDAFGGWVQVKTETLDPDAILAALKAGEFYSSTGPAIKNIEVDGDHFVISCAPAAGVLGTSNHNIVFAQLAGAGPLIEEVRVPIKLTGEKDYYRFTIMAPNKTFAWTNPIWVS